MKGLHLGVPWYCAFWLNHQNKIIATCYTYSFDMSSLTAHKGPLSLWPTWKHVMKPPQSTLLLQEHLAAVPACPHHQKWMSQPFTSWYSLQHQVQMQRG